MAKKRHSIHAIQEALLANTSFMQPEEAEVNVSQEQGGPMENTESVHEQPTIDPKLVRQLRILAMYQNTTPEALIQLAVEDFLALRGRQLQAAILALTSTEEEQ